MSDVHPQQIRKLFAEFDVKKDGLRKADLKRIIEGLVKGDGQTLVEPALDEILARLDHGENGRIQIEQFLDYVYSEPRGEVSASAENDHSSLDEPHCFEEATLRQIFVTYEEAETGSVSVETFEQALKDGAHTIVSKMPVLSTLQNMFCKDADARLELSEFCMLADGLHRGKVPGVPKTCLIKLASQIGELNASFDAEGEPTSRDHETMKQAFVIFCQGQGRFITHAEFAELIIRAAHEFIDVLPVASSMTSMLGKLRDSRFVFEDFCRMADALANGHVPTLPNMDVVVLSPTSKLKPNIKESLLAYS